MTKTSKAEDYALAGAVSLTHVPMMNVSISTRPFSTTSKKLWIIYNGSSTSKNLMMRATKKKSAPGPDGITYCI